MRHPQTEIRALSAEEQKIANTFEPMVHYWAHRFEKSGVPYDDLVQEGWYGVCVAFSKYRPDSGAKFSSVVMPYIRHYIWRFVDETKTTVSLPLSQIWKGNKINMVNMEDPIGPSNGSTTQKTVGDSLSNQAEDPSNSIFNAMTYNKIISDLDKIFNPNDEKQSLERICLEKSFGINCDRMTNCAIAAEIGKSNISVGYYIKSAIEKIKKYYNA